MLKLEGIRIGDSPAAPLLTLIVGHAAVSPGHDTWVAAGAGKTGPVVTCTASQHGAGVELYIDRGKDLGHENIAIFDRLEASRQDIEVVFGEELEWQRLDGKRACRFVSACRLAVTATTNLSGQRYMRRWSTPWLDSNGH